MIRPYENADLSGLLETWEAATRIAHPFLSDEFLATERDNIPNQYLPNAETYVFERDDQVVGFIALIANDVGGLFVHPTHQRQSIGKQLLDKACELRDELEVEVFRKNEPAQNFYQEYGFVIEGEKTHKDTGMELVRMRLAR